MDIPSREPARTVQVSSGEARAMDVDPPAGLQRPRGEREAFEDIRAEFGLCREVQQPREQDVQAEH